MRVVSASAADLSRLPRRASAQRLPRPLADRGLFVVDATWGTVQPCQLAPGVRTVGELEVLEHIEAGGRLVDTRLGEYLAGGTLPTAVHIPHVDIVARAGEIDPAQPTIFFCNGPQCAASPDAIARLLAIGRPAESLLYYRGGIHDWVTLGYPLALPDAMPSISMTHPAA